MEGEDNTVFVHLVVHLEEPNNFAVPGIPNLKRDKHWDRINQIGMESRESGSHLGAEGWTQKVACLGRVLSQVRVVFGYRNPGGCNMTQEVWEGGRKRRLQRKILFKHKSIVGTECAQTHVNQIDEGQKVTDLTGREARGDRVVDCTAGGDNFWQSVQEGRPVWLRSKRRSQISRDKDGGWVGGEGVVWRVIVKKGKNVQQSVVVGESLVGFNGVVVVIIQAASKGEAQGNSHQDWLEAQPRLGGKERQNRGSLGGEHLAGDSRTVCGNNGIYEQ